MNETLINKIRELAGKCRFASFQYKTKQEIYKRTGKVKKGGEVARYVLILGANYQNLLEKSLLAAELLTEKDLIQIFANGGLSIDDCNKFINPLQSMIDARNEVIKLLKLSIESHANGQQNPNYKKIGQYKPLGNGLSLNTNDNSIQLFGLVQSKVVLEKGVYYQTDSAPETIAKNLIQKSLPIGKFREFALDLGNVQGVTMEGETMIFGEQPQQIVVIRPDKNQTENNNDVSSVQKKNVRRDIVRADEMALIENSLAKKFPADSDDDMDEGRHLHDVD